MIVRVTHALNFFYILGRESPAQTNPLRILSLGFV